MGSKVASVFGGGKMPKVAKGQDAPPPVQAPATMPDVQDIQRTEQVAAAHQPKKGRASTIMSEYQDSL